MQRLRGKPGVHNGALLALALGLLGTACEESSSPADSTSDAGARTDRPVRPAEANGDDEGPQNQPTAPGTSLERDASATDDTPPEDCDPPLSGGPEPDDAPGPGEPAAESEPSEPEPNGGGEPAGAGGEEPSAQGGSGTAGNPTSAGGANTGDSGAGTGPIGSGGAVTDVDASTPSGDGTSGCGVTPEASWLEYQSLDIDGLERKYLVSVPPDYDAARPYPLLFAFHGAGDTGQGFKGWSGVESVVEGIYIYPDGVNGIWGEEVYTDDFRLEHAAYEATAERFCVDSARVFAFGFSWGGWTTTQFACNSPELLRGVVEIAGGGPQRGCDVPLPIMLIHGSADEAEPISSSEGTRSIFVELNGCSEETSAFDPSPCLLHQNCEQPVIWCGHDGPHGIPDFSASAIAAFVSALE